MDNIAGSPVEGENFYARETDVMRLREILRNDDILLLGPRRIGKTSIARAVMTVVRAEGWRAIDWFRNDVRAMPEVRTVRWLVSGSVGLDTLVQQHGMADTINSMKHEGLEAFSEDVATGMLAKLATTYTITLSNDDAQKIVAAVLWPQPYYLQLAFHHLRSLMTANPTAQAVVLIEQAIDKLVQPGGDNDFHHWESRLAIQLSAVDAGHRLALLNLAAQAPAGARPENLLAELQGRMPNATQEEARRAFITLRDILQRDAYWWPDESSGRRKWSIYRFWVRWRDAVQGALSAAWRATQARSNAAMRPVVLPKMGYWLFPPP